MKMKLRLLAVVTLLALGLPLSAADKKAAKDRDHAHKQNEAGPNGGRLLTALQPHAEFFVTADRKVQITFLDASDKPVAPAGQTVTVTAGERSAPTKLTFSRSGDVLVSNESLPAGNDFPAVVQIKPSAKSKTVTEKFMVDLTQCQECKHAEYACTCEH